MFLRLFTLLLIQTTGLENNSPISISKSLSYRKVVIQAEEKKMFYELPDRFIITNSEILKENNVTLEREKDYLLNTRDGVLLFLKSVKIGQDLTISYYYLPFEIDKEYKRRSISSFIQGKATVKQNKNEKTLKTYDKTGIVLGGAKTFSIGMNSYGDFSFDQSLKVNISGEIATGLSISGVLSDENTPLEPEGTTESLEQLDRVYIEVKGKRMTATIGDYDVNYNMLNTVVVQRKLLGVTGNFESYGAGFNASFGIPRGKYQSVHIKGIEGKQGPYQLKSTDGEDDIVVVAGTETVYLDGLLLKRGDKNDYVIEYSLAQITFTLKKLITNETDIVVEYQYTRLGFKRNFYSSKAEYEYNNSKVTAFIVREGDDVSQTEGFELTNERKAFLSQLGDDTTANWIESGDYVGIAKGDYSFTDSFYVYRGYRQGEWNVSFTYVGNGKGDYLYSDSLSGFFYVGANNGEYVSKIRVSLPEREDYAGFSVGICLLKALNFQSEILGSDYDRNTLSGLDDGDNRGFVTNLKTDIKAIECNWGKVNLLGEYQYRNEYFKPLYRFQKNDFEEKWNLENILGIQDSRNIGVQYTKDDIIKSRVTLSFLKRKAVSARLEEGIFSLTSKNIPRLDINSSNLEVKGDTISKSSKKNYINTAYSFWRFSPSIFAKQESRTDSDRERWRELGGELGFLLLQSTMLSAGISKRLDEKFINNEKTFDRQSQTITKSFGLKTQQDNILTTNLYITSRERIYENQYPGENTELLLIESSTHFSPLARKVDIEMDYSVTGKNSTLIREMFYEVEEGKGDYNKDQNTGEYYLDTLGSYKRTVEAVGEGNPVTGVKTYTSIEFFPVSVFRCNLTASVKEDNKGTDKIPIYILRLSKFLNDSLTVTGRQSLDGNISLRPQKSTTLFCSFDFLKSLNNQLVTNARRNYSDTYELRLEQALTRKSKLTLDYRHKRDTDESVGTGVEKYERKIEVTPEWSYYLRSNLEVLVGITKCNIKIEEPLWYSNLGIIDIDGETVSTALAYTHLNTAIVNVSLSLTRNSTDTDTDVLPFDVRSFYPTGITTDWKILGNISISNMFALDVSYRGVNRPDKRTLHSANVEVRADF